LAWINFTRISRALLKIPVTSAALLLSVNLAGADYPELDSEQVAWIGEQVFTNECNRSPACLTSWNPGENFPSLGIGHFIWYQAGQQEIFEQSFPALMHFMQDRGVAIPSWIIAENFASPWPGRDSFLADMDKVRLRELRTFLGNTMGEQTAFIIARFENALAAMLASTDSEENAALIADNFYAVAASAPPHGYYALIDYVNFKGTGVSSLESWRGQGWGLKQVLLNMGSGTGTRPESGADALAGFVVSARRTLAARVGNAPVDRNESRWLTGWNKRLDTYLPASAL
jgi:hypothetical protein